MGATVSNDGKCECGFVLSEPADVPRLPCPECGSTVRAIGVSITDGIVLLDSLRFKQKAPGKKKPVAEGLSGASFSRDRNKWVNRTMLVGRQENQYREEVVDPDSGEVIHKCEEPLDKHFGHGSAKKKK